MEELNIKIGNAELKVSGESETIRCASKDFYDFLTRQKAFIQLKNECDCKASELTTQITVKNESTTPATFRTFDTSWEQIAEDIKRGPGLTLGDTVSFTLKSGEQVTVVVTDDTNEYVRFESVDCIGYRSTPWGVSNTECAHFDESSIQGWLMSELFKDLPDDLQRVISKTKRQYMDSEGSLKEYETSLFLPSISEVFENYYGYFDDCRVYQQLDYYKDQMHRIRRIGKGGTITSWWLCSTIITADHICACSVTGEGEPKAKSVFKYCHVPLCFCINK